jgi:hypothetical protein
MFKNDHLRLPRLCLDTTARKNARGTRSAGSLVRKAFTAGRASVLNQDGVLNAA